MAERQRDRQLDEARQAGQWELLATLPVVGIDDAYSWGVAAGVRWFRGLDDVFAVFVNANLGMSKAYYLHPEVPSQDVGTQISGSLQGGFSLQAPFGSYLAPIVAFTYLWYPEGSAEVRDPGGKFTFTPKNVALPMVGFETGYLWGRRQRGRLFMQCLWQPWDGDRFDMPYFVLGIGHAL